MKKITRGNTTYRLVTMADGRKTITARTAIAPYIDDRGHARAGYSRDWMVNPTSPNGRTLMAELEAA